MEKFDLDMPLITFEGNAWPGTTQWTLRSACNGVLCTGSLGAGKSSATGRMLALKYLSKGFGGIVLTAKPDERATFEEYCRLAGRSEDLVIIEPQGQQTFNFLQFVSNNEGQGGNIITENLVEIFKTVIQASEQKNGGKMDDGFWEAAGDMLLFNIVDLCNLAYGEVSLQTMYDIVITLPKSAESLNPSSSKEKTAFQIAYGRAAQKVHAQVKEWEKQFTKEELNEMLHGGIFEYEVQKALPDAKLLKTIDQFFMDTYRNLSEKTRSIVDFSFSGFFFRMLREPVYSLFCGRPSTITPLDCMEGKIIVIDLPVKKYHKVGRDCQIMFKYIAQRCFEKRDITTNERPVFIFQDEFHLFSHEKDAECQTTARSSRILNVFLTQNLPNLYASMSGANSQYRVKSLLGTISTKVFHQNADSETNNYASELFGDAYSEDNSSSSTVGGSSFSTSENTSYRLNRIVRPEFFHSLKAGGPLNDFKVEGFVHIQGTTFPNGWSFDLVTFDQNYIPEPKNKQS